MNDVLKASLPSLLAVSVPSLMVLVGILMNQRAVDSVRADLRDLRADIKTDMGKLNDKMDKIKDSFHDDIVMLVQRDGDKDARISRLEERTTKPPNR
jgi:hypothetical protein